MKRSFRNLSKNLNLLFCLFLTSCIDLNQFHLVETRGVKKHTQKIQLLEKKLEQVKQNKLHYQEECDRIEREINEEKLAWVRKNIEDLEEKKRSSDGSFEKKILSQMIHEGPSPSAFRAQVELDRLTHVLEN